MVAEVLTKLLIVLSQGPQTSPDQVQTGPPPLIRAVGGLVLGPDDQVIDGFRSMLRTEADDVLPEAAENGVLLLKLLWADLAPAQPLLIALPGAGLLSGATV
jgi:hypothetical protein